MFHLRSRVRHLGTAGVAWLILASGAGGAAAPGEVIEAVPDPKRLEVVFEAGILTLEAEHAPLGDVLAAIAERAGFELSVRGAETPISVVLTEVALEEGLRQLLGRGSFVFLYEQPGVDQVRKLVALRGHVSEEAALPEQDRATPSTPGVPIPPGDTELPATTPYDPLEDRLAFARAEARRGMPKAADDLMTLVLEDPDANVRGLAAGALGRLGGAQAGEALVEALSDRDRRVRARAVRALGEAWDERAVAPLAQLLANDRVRSVRRVAAYALSRIEGGAARQALESLRQDRDPRVRRIVASAMRGTDPTR